MEAWQQLWSDEQIRSREEAMTAEVAEAIEQIGKPGCYVNRKALAADKKFLRELRKEMKRRGII